MSGAVGYVMLQLAAPLLTALLLGSLYTLMALGLTMTYAVTSIPNFAHAEFVTIGAYIMAVAVNFGKLGLVGGLASAFLFAALVALATDELVFKKLAALGATPLHLLTASIGVGLVLRYTLSIVADLKGLLSVKTRVVVNPVATIGQAYLTTLHLWAVPTTLAVVAVLHLVFMKTKIGKAMRAMASNLDLARVSGINTTLVRRVTWVIAGGLAGVAGGFWSVYSPINPETGWVALLWIFAASILGGFRSFYGTVLGGYVVGFSESLGITFLSRYLGVNVAYKPMIALLIIVVVFLWKPTGLAEVTPRGLLESLKKAVGR
ncbi:MAG: branched-chain amino acid ABC transporter permease [Thermoproteota archaeon]|nr:MAG: branched-chain amino acid ABC transporter permease [Candidatus Korarchaeota archaeon]RLG53464.1 MAG: branched-chain amino acid ABC transporter permease [Candidatus Korarchaeota archaeon]